MSAGQRLLGVAFRPLRAKRGVYTTRRDNNSLVKICVSIYKITMIRTRQAKSGPVGVLSKVLRVLEVLDASPAGLQLKQVAALTHINKSTAYRFLAHLESEGYLFRSETGAYIVGPKLARLGSGIAYHATLRNVSRPVMQRIWTLTSETVNLAVIDGLNVLYLDVMESPHTFRLASQVGSRLPLHCTALGKAMLAYAESSERDAAIGSLRFERLSPRSITSAAKLRKDLDRILQQGYALDDEEAGIGARCVGAPIFDQSGKVAAAISVSGPVTRINRPRMLAFARAMREGALEISRKLGYTEARRSAVAASA